MSFPSLITSLNILQIEMSELNNEQCFDMRGFAKHKVMKVLGKICKNGELGIKSKTRIQAKMIIRILRKKYKLVHISEKLFIR